MGFVTEIKYLVSCKDGALINIILMTEILFTNIGFIINLLVSFNIFLLFLPFILPYYLVSFLSLPLHCLPFVPIILHP